MKYLFLLYKKMYNDNKTFCDTRRYIITNEYFYYTRRCIIKYLFPLYKTMYNDNKYFYYTRRRIMTINIFIIQEDV